MGTISKHKIKDYKHGNVYHEWRDKEETHHNDSFY